MTSTKQSRSFATYVQKVLKQVHPEGGMTLQAMDAVDFILRYFTRLFAENSRQLALRNDTKTISSSEIEAAVRLLFTSQLADNAVEEGRKAVDTYSSFESHRQSDKQSTSSEFKAPKTMKQTKAGLIFSVSLVDNGYLRHQGVNVGQGAPVYLAAVLEYFASELLSASGDKARDQRRSRIKVRDISLAVSDDDELERLFDDHRLVLLGAGVRAHIDQRILDSYEQKSAKKPRRVTAKTVGTATPHRYRPGTVALREIRQQQKSTRLMLCKVHIQKACKVITATLTAEGDKPVMMSEEARVILHYLVEQKVVDMFRDANEWCLHADRNTLYVGDLQMAMRSDRVEEDCGSELLFTSPPITALARRAGVYRMGGEVWRTMKDYIYRLLRKYLSSAVVVLRHQDRQSINLKVLAEALSTVHDVNICVIPRKIRRTKKSASDTGSHVDDDDVEDLDEEAGQLVNEDDLEDDLEDDQSESPVEEEGLVEEVLDDEDVVETKPSPPRSRVAPAAGGKKKKSPPKKPAAGRKRQQATATK